MECWYPVYLKEQNIEVGCGACPPCRANYSQEWVIRALIEKRYSKSGYFITLTYAQDRAYKQNGEISLKLRHLQNFFKRLRKKIKFRYMATGEYGDRTLRAHYHFLIFLNEKIEYTQMLHLCKTYWYAGFVRIGDITIGRINYIANYVIEKSKIVDAYTKSVGINRQFFTMSRRPGIGRCFLDKVNKDNLIKDFNIHEGRRYFLPRYYRRILREYNEDLYDLQIEEQRKEYLKRKPWKIKETLKERQQRWDNEEREYREQSARQK